MEPIPADPEAPLPQLTERELTVFRWMSRHGEVDSGAAAQVLEMGHQELDDALAVLARLRLVRRLPESPRRYSPVPPESALAELVTPRELALRRQLAETERLRDELTLLAPVYAEARRVDQPRPPLQEVRELETVVGLISDASLRCREEVRTCQPGGGRAPKLLEQAYARDRDMLQRGVRMRTLYQHTARHHPATQEYVRRMTGEGAEVRTLSELFGRMIAFDREVLFLPHQSDVNAAIVVRDPSTVGYLCAVFDHAWSLATPYSPAWSESAAREDVKSAIIRLLAQGMKDEVVARRLGMSLRTCRKHIAEIMEQLGAYSRFQAGYLARVQGVYEGRAGGARPRA
ncbi:LuxR family transcriptional regulator [Streptomyces sp. YIM 98790]|uniref:helix-turn-helix transcriptional regulator n=1 Tax=Streptomyces sp. YIM 98790 TaxID=2689077 RepID=UPI00140A2C2F|nr:LuxR family transcriptional regulator [Streptomyces sp. YIM 98790]